jgi:hypothetical protein
VRHDSFLIQVPDDSLSYNINSLIKTSLSYAYPQSPIYEEKIRRGQTNGYPALDAAAHVPAAQLGANAHAGYVLGTDGSIASWQAGAGYAFNTGQFTIVNTTNIAIGPGAALTNLHTWSLLNTHAFTNSGKIVAAFANDSVADGAATADMTVATNAHLILENTSGDQTKILFTFAGGPRGGVRSDLSGNLNWHSYGAGCHQFWNSLDTSVPTMVLRGGKVGIGVGSGSLPNEMLEVANGALLMDAISAPSAILGGAKLYARDNGGTTEMFVLDDAGNETQISPHAMDGPPWLYDPDDPFPHVVREANHYLGIVRYTNLSRQSALLQKLLLGMDLTSLAPEQRTVFFTESFQEHNFRLPAESAFVVRAWPKPAGPEPVIGTNVPTIRVTKPVPQWLKTRGVN